MTINKFLKKFLLPALVLGVLVYILLVFYRKKFVNYTSNKSSNKSSNKFTIDTCTNSFTQLLVMDTCYECPQGYQGISWVSPGYVQCSNMNNQVINAIQK
jgi:hypothetical protein